MQLYLSCMTDTAAHYVLD